MSLVEERRVRFRDIKPYDVPESLDELHGPLDGIVSLPQSVYWQADRFNIDLSRPGKIEMVYQNVLAEGLLEDICRFVNADHLRRVWRNLRLDRRLRQMWEERFPELR